MINKQAMRPYTVQKAFVFRGMAFKTGDTFDPVKAQCDAHKLYHLIHHRLLDGTSVPTKKAREVPSQPPAPADVPTPAEATEQGENAGSDANSPEAEGEADTDAPAPAETDQEGEKEEKPSKPRRKS